MIKFENPSNGRYYYLQIERDLLNDSILRVNYGGKNIHRNRIIFCGSGNSILQEIDRISKRRVKRGYVLVG